MTFWEDFIYLTKSPAFPGEPVYVPFQTWNPWGVFIFCFAGMIAIIVVYSYSELVWCKEVKKDAKKK
jgi:hypothetical protein